MAYIPDVSTTLGRFLDAWNAEDADARWAHVHAATADHVVVLEPEEPTPIEGRAALAFALDTIRRRAGSIAADGPATIVHDTACLPVQVGGAAGLLVATVGNEGRLVRVVLFTEAAPTL